jgi:hypothetical protein
MALKQVRGLIIAVDLEGTLVSNAFHLEGQEERLWLRRPLAAEALQILSVQNTVVIWTAASRAAVNLILEQTNLDLPETIEISTLEDTSFALGQPEWRSLWERIDHILRSFKCDTELQPCHVKLPRWAGFNVLLDDQVTKFHGAVAGQIPLEDESERMIAVHSYGQKDQETGEFWADPYDCEWHSIAYDVMTLAQNLNHSQIEHHTP